MQPSSEDDEQPSRPGTGREDGRPIAELVVRTVADAEDCAAESLPPITDSIDPDALDVLVSSEDTIRVAFEYAGHDVTVSSATDVTVE